MDSDPQTPSTAAIATRLGFGAPWFALGLVDADRLQQDWLRWREGEDRHPEHYRYGAFRDFLARHGPLSVELAIALYQLGAADPDPTLGGSMMADVLKRPECPSALLEAAMASDRPHLVRIARRRRPPAADPP